MQDEVLAETLNSCDVSVKDRSRDAETYDFSFGQKYYNDEDKKPLRGSLFKEEPRSNNKRTRTDRNNVNFRQRKRSHSRDNQGENSCSKPRFLLDLNVSIECNEEDIARDISNKLYEEKQDLICKYFFRMVDAKYYLLKVKILERKHFKCFFVLKYNTILVHILS